MWEVFGLQPAACGLEERGIPFKVQCFVGSVFLLLFFFSLLLDLWSMYVHVCSNSKLFYLRWPNLPYVHESFADEHDKAI
jgi:hypothetical protein